MFAKGLLSRVFTTARNRALVQTTQRHASTTTTAIKYTNNLDMTFLQHSSKISKEPVSVATVSEYVSRLRPFSAPAPPQPTMTTPTKVVEELEMTSVLRKRRLKMNKHKHKKLRKRTRALRKKLALSQSRKEGYGPGGIFAIPKLKPINEAKHCFECGVVFNLFKQKYHCRNCGNVVCSNCSNQKHPLNKFGYDNPVRCCDTCDKFINMQSMNSSDLNKLSAKILKEYINAYNLPAKAAIEKSDLIKIIFNTRPISNEQECYYRRNRTRSAVKSSEDNSFSFSNLVQDLFTPNNSSSSSGQQQQQQKEQQRQQQEQYRRQQQQQQRQREQQQRAERERLERQQREQFERQQREQFLRQQRQQQFQSNNSSFSTTSQHTPSPRQSPSPSNDNLLSLHDMVKADIDPASLSVRTLKSILKANYVEQSHVIEKSELVKLVQRLADQHRSEMQTKGDDSEGGSGNDDTLCRVCFDAQQNCVFLDCGHMVTCMDCAKKLIETKNECPICREPIIKLVHVFRS